MKWEKWFAWYPVETIGHHWAWLKTVGRRWNWKMNFRIIDPYDPGDYDGGWEYRLLPATENIFKKGL
jgi:hypothetical protein